MGRLDREAHYLSSRETDRNWGMNAGYPECCAVLFKFGSDLPQEPHFADVLGAKYILLFPLKI